MGPKDEATSPYRPSPPPSNAMTITVNCPGQQTLTVNIPDLQTLTGNTRAPLDFEADSPALSNSGFVTPMREPKLEPKLKLDDNIDDIIELLSSSDGSSPEVKKEPKTPGRARPVNQLTRREGIFVKRWPSLKAAAEGVGGHRSHISQCCHGNLNYHHGFRWEFARTPIQKSSSETSWEDNFDYGDFAQPLQQSSDFLNSSFLEMMNDTFTTPIRPRQVPDRFLDSEHCEQNILPRKRPHVDRLTYTDGVSQVFCTGHLQQSTRVFPVGCKCQPPPPHCLQCLTTRCDSHGTKKCYQCNQEFQGVRFA